eukprot:3476709-Rhodomonas_salina.1
MQKRARAQQKSSFAESMCLYYPSPMENRAPPTRPQRGEPHTSSKSHAVTSYSKMKGGSGQSGSVVGERRPSGSALPQEQA